MLPFGKKLIEFPILNFTEKMDSLRVPYGSPFIGPIFKVAYHFCGKTFSGVISQCSIQVVYLKVSHIILKKFYLGQHLLNVRTIILKMRGGGARFHAIAHL